MFLNQLPRPLNIAHRGARSLAPENTLYAVRKGFEAKAHLWELDVTLSADGVPFLLHDDTLERTTNVASLFPERAPWLAHEFTFEELRRLDAGTWFNETDPFGCIAAGQTSAEDLESYRGALLPTLREALEYTRALEWMVNIEIKDLSFADPSPRLVEKVLELIHDTRTEEQVIISSFNHTYLRWCKERAPLLPTAALVEEAAEDPVALLKDLNAQAYNPGTHCVDAATIQKVRQAGFDVFIWTVNDEPAMRELTLAGASGLFTDKPQVYGPLLESLQR